MFTKLINDLIASGLSEQGIADLVIARGVQVNQSTINRIKSGEIRNPRYEVGTALVELHKSVCKPKARSKQGDAQAVRA